MKNKMCKSNKILGFILSAILVIESSGTTTMAAQLPSDTSAEVIEYAVSEGDMTSENSGSGDGTDYVTDGDISSDDNNGAENRITLADDTSDSIASGTYYGMIWSISNSYELTISGVYNDAEEGTSWHDYAAYIASAKVTAVEVKSTRDWFRNLTELKSVDFSGFDSGSVRNMNGMFYKCSSLEKIKWSNAKTVNVTDMGFMFYGCRKLQTLDVSMFDTRKVTDMRYMFSGCSALTELAVGGFNTEKVTDMTGMFDHCSSVTRLNVSNFNTAKVTDMGYMFADCISLKNLDVSSFDTSAVTNMSSMFQNCGLLTTLNVSGFDTTKVQHMSAMFYGCSSLTSLDVSNFNTAYVTNMTHMFSDCRELAEINFGEFSTVRVTDADYMFYKCYKLTKLDLSSFNLLNVKSAANMLSHCGALEQLKTPTSLKVEVALPFEMQETNGKRYKILPQNKYVSITLQPVPYGAESIPDQVYTGKAIKPEIKVVKNGEVLTRGVDYTVSYKNNKNVASADETKAPTVIVKGKGRYSGSFTSTFNIVAKELTAENTSVGEIIVKANNKVQTPRPVVTVDGRRLVFNKDFVVEYPIKTEGAYREPGRYEVVVKGKGNYTGMISTSIVILGENQIKASELEVEKIPACTYQEGVPATPIPMITYKGEELNLDEDISLSYENNALPGKATLIITGLENAEGKYVAGTLKKTFTIKGSSLSKVAVSYKKTATYTGYGIYPEVTLANGDKVLVPDVDYTIEYVNNINVGKAKIVLTGCGGYTGVVRKTFAIQPEEGVGDMLDVSVGDAGVAEYTRNGVKPEVVVKLDNTVLQPGIDYTVYYHNNKSVAKTNAVKAPAVVIKGKGNYKFTRRETFTITEKSLGDADITITVADKYKGATDLRSRPVIKDGAGNTLKLGEDYTIVGYKIGGVDYNKNNIPADATRAIVTVKGKGGYTGEISTMYRITEKNITQTNVVAKNLEYNGGSVEYTSELISLGMLVLTDRKTNEELEYGVDYEIIGYKNNAKRGYATVIIRGLGDYGGTRNIKFRIVTTKIPL